MKKIVQFFRKQEFNFAQSIRDFKNHIGFHNEVKMDVNRVAYASVVLSMICAEIGLDLDKFEKKHGNTNAKFREQYQRYEDLERVRAEVGLLEEKIRIYDQVYGMALKELGVSLEQLDYYMEKFKKSKQVK